MRFAMVENDQVVSVIVWDGEEEYEAPEGVILVPCPDEVATGWFYEDGEWLMPPPSEPYPEPEEDPVVHDAKQSALAELVGLGVSEATARTIVGLPASDI